MWDQGAVVTVSRMQEPLLTKDMVMKYAQNPVGVLCSVQTMASYTELEAASEVHKLYHVKLKMPFVISNRSMIVCYGADMAEEESAGVVRVIGGSHNTDCVAASQKKQIGKNVLGFTKINYMEFTKRKEGTGYDVL